jgi:hypothetical protein
MNNQKLKIKRAIYRSQLAYGFYSRNKLYYNALRIYKANQVVYDLLNIYIYECDEDDLDIVTSYIFHLEDWFEQFKVLELTIIKLDDEFIFIRFDDSPAFPKRILDII